MAYRKIEEAREAILASSPSSKVYIGCDSKRYPKTVDGKKRYFARYSVVVILHKDGRHGGQIFQDTCVQDDYGSVKQRMLTEVGLAVQAAMGLVDAIGDREFSLHVDINKDERHKSNEALSEARGWVLGTLGIEPVFKPDALAASYAADHVCRM